MKKCMKCKEVKSFSEFSIRRSNKDGYYSYCKECSKEKHMKWYRSIEGVLSTIYKSQIQSCKRRNHNPPKYTKEQFIKSMLIDDEFKLLYLKWERSGYSKDLKPSIDRLNDYDTYSFDNMRIVTWKENNEKGWNDRKNGINNKHSKSIFQISLDGNIIKEWHSSMQVERELGINHAQITQVCKGNTYSAGGFKWKYKEGI